MTALRYAGNTSVAAVLVSIGSAAIAQAPSTLACVTAPGLNNVCNVNSNTPTELSATNIGVAGIPIASGAAKALAQFGTLKASTTATELLYPAQGASSNGSSSAFAQVRDSLSISNPALNGKQGFVDLRIDYSWLFSNDAASSNGQFNTADVTLEFGASAAYARQQYAQGALVGTVESVLVPIGLVGNSVTALDAELGAFFTVRMPFVFGTEYVLRQSLSLGSNASFGATASIDAFNSAYWGGMVVRDGDLNSVAFSALSGSGTDYTKSFVPGAVAPVPEPSTWLLMAIGLAALGVHQRRRLRPVRA